MFSVNRNLEGSWKTVLKHSLQLLSSHYESNALKRGRHIDQISLIYGYRRYHPLKGLQMSLWLSHRLRYQKKSQENILMTRVTKHMYIENQLGAPEIREMSINCNEKIHLILPLSEKSKEFSRFLHQFEIVCSTRNLCDLFVVLYDSPHYQQTLNIIKQSILSKYINVIHGRGAFSRALALHQAVQLFEKTDLIFFIDVDIHFDDTTLERIRQHTVLNVQVYSPIVFNQYDSHIVCGSTTCPIDIQQETTGAFRFFGFGITSMYQADYVKSGGFDLSIQGWGKEDVDLYTKILKSGLKVFRAPDPSITHIYHPKVCDESLNIDQAKMCLNSKATSFASKQSLAKLYFENHPDS